MKVFVINVSYSETEEVQKQAKKVYVVDKYGNQQIVNKENIIFEKHAVIVLACKDETEIMAVLQGQVSDKITSFELVNEIDLSQLQEVQQTDGDGMQLMSTTPTGIIIFQSGI